MTKIELLAPVRDLDCGKLASDCGADAVYIGASDFGARHAVGYSLDDIQALAEYAHRYWASVFVTVNTILRDDEIEPAVRMVHELHDVGLLECGLPPIPNVARRARAFSTMRRSRSFARPVGLSCSNRVAEIRRSWA